MIDAVQNALRTINFIQISVSSQKVAFAKCQVCRQGWL